MREERERNRDHKPHLRPQSLRLSACYPPRCTPPRRPRVLLSPKYKTLYTPAPLILPVPLRPPASVSRIAAQFVGDDLKVVLLVRGDLGMSPGMRVCARAFVRHAGASSTRGVGGNCPDLRDKTLDLATVLISPLVSHPGRQNCSPMLPCCLGSAEVCCVCVCVCVCSIGVCAVQGPRAMGTCGARVVHRFGISCICMPYMYASFVYMYALHVCPICLPYMYA